MPTTPRESSPGFGGRAALGRRPALAVPQQAKDVGINRAESLKKRKGNDVGRLVSESTRLSRSRFRKFGNRRERSRRCRRRGSSLALVPYQAGREDDVRHEAGDFEVGLGYEEGLWRIGGGPWRDRPGRGEGPAEVGTNLTRLGRRRFP